MRGTSTVLVGSTCFLVYEGHIQQKRPCLRCIENYLMEGETTGCTTFRVIGHYIMVLQKAAKIPKCSSLISIPSISSQIISTANIYDRQRKGKRIVVFTDCVILLNSLSNDNCEVTCMKMKIQYFNQVIL